MPCLHLGGNAAFECYSTGERACGRCKKRGAEIEKRCHQPTAEDIAQMDRRCTRCKEKGNKNCDEKAPCAGCIKQQAKDRAEGKPSFLVDNCKLDREVRQQLILQTVDNEEVLSMIEDVEDEHTHHDEHPNHDEVDGLHQEEDVVSDEQVQDIDENEMTILPIDKEELGAYSLDVAAQGAYNDTRVESNETSPSPALASSIADHIISTGPSDFEEEMTEVEARPSRRSPEVRVSQQSPTFPEQDGTRRKSQRSCTQDKCYKEVNVDYEGNISNVREDPDADDDEEAYESQESDSESEDGEPDDSEKSDSDHQESGYDDEDDELDSRPKSRKKLIPTVVVTEDESVSLPRLQKKDKKKGGPSRHLKKPLGEVIDLDLPPLSDIYECFGDLVSNAVELGLCDALKSIGRPINIGTMCSGTEAPLVAINLISEALEKAGLPAIRFEHHFSAEIEAIKQSYIERNFRPTRLFRDVREFIPDDATTATTAYGAEEDIPECLDIVIAGFVCKNLSSLNSHKLELTDKGESGDTWRALLSYANRFGPSIVLVENVLSEEDTWNDVVSMWDEVGYAAEWVYCDTKNFYIPQTRQRMYMIAIKRELFGKNVDKAVGKWRDTMQQLQRKCSVPYEAFLTKTLQESSNHSARISEPDWALCKLRYDHIRSEERLGNLHPITQWSANGTVRPPDFANKKWYNSQSSRVWDAIDVAHLQGVVQSGSDSLYKMASWDVSQNVDRFKDKLGILGCITPKGCNFATNRQQALNGTQLLIMQGQPVDKLLFANETQRDCQDLAGNAMTTTVIGASLISAIICGVKSFRTNPPSALQQSVAAKMPTISKTVLDKPGSLDTCIIPEHFDCMNMAMLASDGWLSSRLCNCEESGVLCDSAVRICSTCKHTACSACAGNPRHKYQDLKAGRTQSPHMFIKEWRSKFPPRLKIDQLPDLRNPASSKQPADKHTKAFWERVEEAQVGLDYFYIGDLVRQDNVWKMSYTSTEATLELRIGRDIQWLLFVKCLPTVPSSSHLRKMLEQPIARGKVKSSLMDPEWEVFIHHPMNCMVQISGSSKRTSSGRNREGLADFSEETVPETLTVWSASKEAKPFVGDYDYLPHCGTASHNLYKRRLAKPDVYLFSDPNPIGPENGMVFSEDCSRRYWGDVRLTMARLDLAWRPSDVQSGQAYNVNADIAGTWTPVVMKLKSPHVAISASTVSGEAFVTPLRDDCSHALSVLEVNLQERIRIQKFSDYFWVLERASKLLPDLSAWQPFQSESASDCMCAPTQPPIHWSVDKKVATPHEERQAAAKFERAIKTRRDIFEVLPSNEHKTTRIEIGVNVSSLIHRARGRLAHLGPVTTSWRLITDHTTSASKRFPKFRLLDNSQDGAVESIPAVGYLHGAQPKALSWMRSQELGRVLTVTEVEEAVDSQLGWRAEAQAQIDVKVRGGVLADLPSFGKTVTTIALIQSEFEQHTPKKILNHNRGLTAGLPGRINVAATLIVCPRHIAEQWRTEFRSFLGTEKYELYDVKVILSFTDLQKLTVEDFKASRVIIVSWKVLSDPRYINQLARFAGIPEPVTTNCRAFNAGLARIMLEIPDRLEDLQDMDFHDFDSSLDVLLEDRLRRAEFQAVLPLKIQHGKAYKSYAPPVAKGRGAGANGKSLPKRKSSGSATHQVPLLHLFRWNRIVVDEYHYLNSRNNIENGLIASSVKCIAAPKRWVLSGTPALTNFSDVNEIASFLDVKLGRNAFGDGSATTQLERGLIKDQTSVEKFLSRTQLMSDQWHQARHDRAQMFLDLFVRQNEPSLQYIKCSETLRPVELNIAHHAVYLELSQHLDSQRMQIRKLNNKNKSDRQNRLNQSLDNFPTAEAALLHYALQYKTSDGESGLDSLVRDRSNQRLETEAELTRLVIGFEGYLQRPQLMKSIRGINAKDDSLNVYERLKADISSNWLGDEDASLVARKILDKAKRHPNANGFLEKKTRDCFRRGISDARDCSRELTDRIRSERFVNNIKGRIFPSLLEGEGPESLTCDAPSCKGGANVTQLRLLYECGHVACDDCLMSRTDDERCVATGCGVCLRGNLIQASELGTTSEKVSGKSFGEKLDAVAELIKSVPNNDQSLVFAPNDKTIRALREVFSHHKISFQTADDDIEKFKTTTDPAKRKKALILNQGGESAAGINLVNANHIFFVAPLLVDSQDQYDAAMAQAEARSRRYGQKKIVHIYHFAALRTIDVDILEHRHRRKDAITTSSKAKLPPPLAEREKTRLVKNDAGQVALVPLSMVADEAARKILGITEAPKSFTSLINFSENFERGEDDDV
ncbi:hypothetical protein P153DRAFT_372163 [Dothidotthia symphoricarpi CBS 119687]|uniref:Helicase ATP-binding domain-containing protein n=1 Tax=Dothidotthia symphoricarpi CBS 119687 TaxID=1392245 RepID=A0A6A6AWJ0_9PLEO|nr:uncharacterized protein P153DRAFT_372163 [Dothidotthia symphoricarpi CBS 119687]KAF2134891.1 hypothetical protein P153DRAFT_372163 [Dothidotthia symphoricarpi CBS 119687]